MNQQNKHSEFAAQIRAAYAGTPIAPIRTQLAELDVDAAYAIQQENTAHWQAEGRGLVGSKIGLTSRAVQNQLGVDRPDFGVLFADMMVAEDEPVAAGRVLQPKIEAEVAFLLDRDVDFVTAMITSVRAVVASPGPMIGWAAIITVLLIISALPYFLGLLVTVPVLGHATWHLYRRIVAPA